MKIVISYGESFVGRNLFLTDWWLDLLKKLPNDTKFILVCKSDLKDQAKRYVLGYEEKVSVVVLKPSFKKSLFTPLILSLARSCLGTRTNLWSKMRSYYRNDSSFFSTTFKRIFSLVFGDSPFMKKMLRDLIEKLSVNLEIHDFIKLEKPNLFISTSMTNFEFDIPLSVAMRANGIKVIGLPRSWDNFTSHGLTRFWPDNVIVVNQYLKDMALRHQAVPDKCNILVAGVPHYDIWQKNNFISKNELFSRLNIPLTDKIIVYGAMGSFLFPNEEKLPKIFNHLVESGLLPANVKFVYRMHPRFPLPPDKRKAMPFIVFDRQSDEEVTANMQREDMLYLASLIYHSSLVVTAASTFAIDATVLDRPVVLLNFDGDDNINYWESVNRFYDSYDHFQKFVEVSRLPIANTINDLATKINVCFDKNTSSFGKNRQMILDLFVGSSIGNNGHLLADKTVESIKNLLSII